MKEAFDLIKERLEEASFVDYDEYYTDNGECLVTISDVLSIISEVEAEHENDVCEWKGIDMLGLYNSSCLQKSIVNPFWKHCPYCGKKIKVVE